MGSINSLLNDKWIKEENKTKIFFSKLKCKHTTNPPGLIKTSFMREINSFKCVPF